MITTRARVAWYACLVLTILGIQIHAAMLAIVVLGLAGVAFPSLLLAAYGPAGLREMLPTIRLGGKPHEGRITTMHTANGRPEPVRGDQGAVMTAPANVELERQTPDLLVPPTTDHRPPMAGWYGT